MNGHPRHPGTEELAEFRAGVTDGVRGDQVAAHLAECPECASVADRLGEVPALLASVPVPAMPAAVEARITSALTAEAARRAAAPVDVTAEDAATPDPALADPDDSSPLPNPVVPLSSAPRRRRSARRRTSRRRAVTAPLGALVATAACLVLAFVGYQLSGTGHHGGSAAASGSSPSLHARENNSAGGQGLEPGPRPGPDTRMGPGSTAAWVVVVSTTNFRKATLQEQVRQQLSATHSTGPIASPGTSGSAGPVKPSAGVTPVTGGDRRVSPSESLVGCVRLLTNGTQPQLVEQATYQSQLVYMIAIANHAWVVGRGCTAAHPELLASVALPGR
ncbi:MAG TPA: hypothetical protein VF060_31905 [Trebonia sp.]